jgi:predicted metal-binding membrane protein
MSMLSPRVDDRRIFIAVLVGLIALAWAALFVWQQSPYGRFLEHHEVAHMEIGLDGDAVRFAALFISGWTLMTFAMMLPTSLPLIQMFQTMTRARADRLLLTSLLIGGYLAVWAGFGVAAHLGDWLLHQAVVARLASHGDRAWVVGSVTLVGAGLYQFTPLKYHCLDKCRSPFAFITEHWRGDRERFRSLLLGAHHGLFCVGCCWSLMMLMFAVGVGNLGWMLALGAVMAVEKNMPWGRRMSAPLGVGLIAAGIGVIVFAVLGA